MTLSPRAPLGAHQTKLTAAAAVCDELQKPVHELADRINAETAALRGDEAAHAALLASEAAAVFDCTSANYVAKIAAAKAQVERRQRAIATLQGKMAEVEAPLRDAQLSASIAASRTEALIANVIAGEVIDDVLAEYFDSQRKFAQAEAKARTLAGECVRRKWMSLAEKVHVSINTTPPARWNDQKFPDWPAFIAALASDAHAAVPAVLS